MNRKQKMILFSLMISIVSFIGHYFVFATILPPMESQTPINKVGWSIIVTVILVICLLAPRIQESDIARNLFYVCMVWGGIAFQLLFWSGCYQILNLIIPIPHTLAVILIVIITASIVGYGLYNAQRRRLVNVDIKLRGIKSQVRIVHLTDIHLGPIYGKEFVHEIVQRCIVLNPNYVVITGDIFDGTMRVSPEVLKPFDSLTMPVYFVIGNHEEIYDLDESLALLGTTKIIVIRDSIVKLPEFNFVGIDFGKGTKYLRNKLTMMNLSPDETNILLYHVPCLKVDELEKYNVNLHLTGHTHGGQMFPFTLFLRLAHAYAKGLHSSISNRSHIFVSTGVGTAGPPIRTGTNSMIALVTLNPAVI